MKGGLDRASALDLLRVAAAERDAAQAAMKEHQRIASGYGLLIEGILGMFPDLTAELERLSSQVPLQHPSAA